MKTVLNVVIFLLIITICSDFEENSRRTDLNYSTTLFASAGLLIVGFFRVYLNEFVEFITKPQ